MTKRMYFGGVALVCASILGAATISAQEKPRTNAPQDAGQDDAMAQMMANMQPGPEHEKLAERVGTYDVEVTQWMNGPENPGTVSPATSELSMLCDGRYLHEHVTGEVMGMPFEGYGVLGYDNAKATYVSMWIDNMGTGIMSGTGHYDGDIFKSKMKGTDPMTGKDMTMRAVETKMSNGSIKVEMYGPDPATGKEVKAMQLVYTKQ